MDELAPGLWRWTAACGGPGGWERDVASAAVASDGVLVVVDPLHERNAREVAARYGAAVRASDVACSRLRCEAEPIGDAFPGLVALPLGGVDGDGLLLRLPGHVTLVAEEALTGTAEGLRTSASPKLVSRDAWRASLDALLEPPVERVLPAHGPPALERGREAIAAALARPDWSAERPR